MCGIFGFAKTSNRQSDRQIDILKRVFTELTDESSIRGEDSTGFSIINPESRYTYKTLTDSSTLVNRTEWSNVIDYIDRRTTIAMGHVRYATHGKVNVNNAHPFDIGRVTGAHNGVIYNYNQVARAMGKDTPEVDSQVLFQSLNRKEMSRAFESINGDFAITWVKDSNKKIHLARESGRPMVVAYWKKARVLLWASTRDIMADAMIKAGIRLPIHNVNEDYIFTYDTEKFEKKPSVEMVKFETISQRDYNSYYGSYHGGMSPATMRLYGNVNGKREMCDYCYEYLPHDEIEVDSNSKNVCLTCEYSPSYTIGEGQCYG